MERPTEKHVGTRIQIGDRFAIITDVRPCSAISNTSFVHFTYDGGDRVCLLSDSFNDVTEYQRLEPPLLREGMTVYLDDQTRQKGKITRWEDGYLLTNEWEPRVLVDFGDNNLRSFPVNFLIFPIQNKPIHENSEKSKSEIVKSESTAEGEEGIVKVHRPSSTILWGEGIRGLEIRSPRKTITLGGQPRQDRAISAE